VVKFNICVFTHKSKYEKNAWLVFQRLWTRCLLFVLICSRAWNNSTTIEFSTWPNFLLVQAVFVFHKKGKTQSIISLGCFCFFTDTHLYDTLVVAPTDWFFCSIVFYTYIVLQRFFVEYCFCYFCLLFDFAIL